MGIFGEKYRFDPRLEADEVITPATHRIRHGVLGVLQHATPTQAQDSQGSTIVPHTPLPDVRSQNLSATSAVAGGDSHTYALPANAIPDHEVLSDSISLLAAVGANDISEVYDSRVAAAREKLEEEWARAGNNGAGSDA